MVFNHCWVGFAGCNQKAVIQRMKYRFTAQKPASKTTSRFWFQKYLFLQWTEQLWTSQTRASFSINFSMILSRNQPLSYHTRSTARGTRWAALPSPLDRRGWVLTSWLRCSMAKSLSQDLYSSMPPAVLRTSCGRSIRQGSPRHRTDSTAVAQLLSVIRPARRRKSCGDLWEMGSWKDIKTTGTCLLLCHPCYTTVPLRCCTGLLWTMLLPPTRKLCPCFPPQMDRSQQYVSVAAPAEHYRQLDDCELAAPSLRLWQRQVPHPSLFPSLETTHPNRNTK